MKFSYLLGDQEVTVKVEGQTAHGEPVILLDADDDLARGQPWYESGFVVEPFLSLASYEALVAGVRSRLLGTLREAGAVVTAPFALTDYHHYVADDAMHLRALREARAGYPLDDFPIALAEVVDRVSTLLGIRVTPKNERYGLDSWHARVVRPCSNDHNPPHRDVWLDRLRNAVNIYVPLAGSDARTSLPLAPGSHRWPESELVRTAQGATVNGVNYTVPTVVGCDHPLHLVRPNPRANEFLLFSPYLVHGGGRNEAADHTRVSLEMRFWRADR